MTNTNTLHRQADVAKLLRVSRAAVAQYVKRNPADALEVGRVKFLTQKGLARWQKARAKRAENLLGDAQ